MASSARPVGGFIVKQRTPRPVQAPTWREPHIHQTLDEAFDQAERLARREGVSFSILQEVGCADPVLREVEPPRAPESEAVTTLRAVEWSVEVDMEDGGYEPGCPACGEPQRLGHSARCRIAATLAKAEGR